MTVNTSVPAPYNTGFLDTIVGVGWAKKSGETLLSFSATKTVNGLVPPDCAKVTLAFDKNESLLDSQVSCVQNTVPAHTTITKVFVVWADVIPRPTPANYQNVVFDNQAGIFVQYGGQFSLLIDVGRGFVDPNFVNATSTGFYPTAAAAAAVATEFNNTYASNPLIVQMFAFLTPGINNVGGPFAFTPVGVVEIDVPNLIPAQSTATLAAKYLVKVPLDPATMRATVTGSDSNALTASGYSKPGITKISQLPTKADSTSSAALDADGSYLINTQITIAGNQTTVLPQHGGGGGPH